MANFVEGKVDKCEDIIEIEGTFNYVYKKLNKLRDNGIKYVNIPLSINIYDCQIEISKVIEMFDKARCQKRTPDWFCIYYKESFR